MKSRLKQIGEHWVDMRINVCINCRNWRTACDDNRKCTGQAASASRPALSIDETAER